MSVFELAMAGLPGVTMEYEDGGRVQVFRQGSDREVRVPGNATDAEVIAAFRALDERDVDA